MSRKYYVERLSYHKDRNLQDFHRLTEEMFNQHEDDLKKVIKCARKVSDFINQADSFIQRYTEDVCPSCKKVCCINKHAYHEHEDIVYLYALGERLPHYEKNRDDSEPCQFLEATGCSVRRVLRPYRCTWYFCTPLLERMQEASAQDYRRFIVSLQQLTQKREEMLNEFVEIVDKIKRN